MRRWILSVGIALLLTLLGYCALRKGYLFHSTLAPSTPQVDELRTLGKKALRSGDVPVAALLLYNDTIIGRGYNTVLRDGDAGGHAEVNAVSDALRTLGHARFAALDRDRLLLLTTYEPCAMCRGMMLEDRITHVAFIRPKTLRHWLGDDLRSIRLEARQQLSGPEGLQDSLFRMHPAYDPAADK